MTIEKALDWHETEDGPWKSSRFNDVVRAIERLVLWCTESLAEETVRMLVERFGFAPDRSVCGECGEPEAAHVRIGNSVLFFSRVPSSAALDAANAHISAVARVLDAYDVNHGRRAPRTEPLCERVAHLARAAEDGEVASAAIDAARESFRTATAKYEEETDSASSTIARQDEEIARLRRKLNNLPTEANARISDIARILQVHPGESAEAAAERAAERAAESIGLESRDRLAAENAQLRLEIEKVRAERARMDRAEERVRHGEDAFAKKWLCTLDNPNARCTSCFARGRGEVLDCSYRDGHPQALSHRNAATGIKWDDDHARLTARVQQMQEALDARGVDLKFGDEEEQLAAAQKEVRKLRDLLDSPAPMLLWCPACRERHVDRGDFATRPHKIHACQSCGNLFQPALVSTVGVRFLPRCRDGE